MIEIEHLTKRFGGVTALDDVSFAVPSGRIVGFLGPNGAGKSTCLRILMGLVRPDAGTATIEGVRYQDLPNPACMVGSMLSAEDVHPGRTGRETLLLATRTLGLPDARVAEAADEVGLTASELKGRVGTYSLGMRQRLALAQALLGDPRVLILDEPTNGLDPQGQRWLGTLLADRASRGCAVLLSSHQLHDVARIADRVVMIGRGHVLADQPLGDDLDADDLESLYFDLTASADRSAL